jgi:ribose/xylose/arabinose/galactoside ABC-type transport system permease subunit
VLFAAAALRALSPFGHVLVAIRENEQRATFQGYDTNRYKLLAFVLSPASPAWPARCWSSCTGWRRPSRRRWPSAASCWRWW